MKLNRRDFIKIAGATAAGIAVSSMGFDLKPGTKVFIGEGLIDSPNDLTTISEDVGRHNALDKAIGTLFLDRTLKNARLLVLSSRISYELVQKAARARIPMIVSKSRPTTLAVDMEKSLNMTLACAFESKNLIIFSGDNRIKKE